MTTIKLSFRNIKKSFKDYAIYFFTLILGVAIFYVFNSIESQTVLSDVTNSTHEVIDLMTNMLYQHLKLQEIFCLSACQNI